MGAKKSKGDELGNGKIFSGSWKVKSEKQGWDDRNTLYVCMCGCNGTHYAQLIDASFQNFFFKK